MKNPFWPLTIIVLIAIISSCKTPPEASFTHSSDSYEAGDTVNFTSTSTDASSLDWEFGDGSSSTEEEPYNIYSNSGTYSVKLTATNDDGSDEATESVTIKDPTILAFVVTEGDSETPIPNCAVFLYDNQTDWENSENYVGGAFTDNDGYVEFYHAKPIVYYIDVIKEVANGIWIWYGSTGTVTANEFNGWYIPAEFYSNKKSAKSDLSGEIKKLERNIK